MLWKQSRGKIDCLVWRENSWTLEISPRKGNLSSPLPVERMLSFSYFRIKIPDLNIFKHRIDVFTLYLASYNWYNITLFTGNVIIKSSGNIINNITQIFALYCKYNQVNQYIQLISGLICKNSTTLIKRIRLNELIWYIVIVINFFQIVTFFLFCNPPYRLLQNLSTV